MADAPQVDDDFGQELAAAFAADEAPAETTPDGQSDEIPHRLKGHPTGARNSQTRRGA
jgi:hypothetical protein